MSPLQEEVLNAAQCKGVDAVREIIKRERAPYRFTSGATEIIYEIPGSLIYKKGLGAKDYQLKIAGTVYTFSDAGGELIEKTEGAPSANFI